MRYLLLCCFWLCLLRDTACAQQPDSLMASVKGFREDSSGIRKLLEEGARWQATRPEKSRYFFNRALMLSHSIKNQYFEVCSMLSMVRLLMNINKYDSAIEVGTKALAISKANSFKENTGLLLNNIGAVYMYLNQPDVSVTYYMDAIPYMAGDSTRLTVVMTNLSNLFNSMMQTEKALEYGKRSIVFAQASRAPKWIAFAYDNLGIVYTSAKNNEKARECFETALEYSRQTDDINTRMVAYRDMANFDQVQGNIIRASLYADSCLYYAKQLSSIYSFSNACLLSGRVHSDLKHYDLARKLFYDGKDAAEKSGEWMIMQEAYQNISDFEKKTGHPDKAYEYLNKLMVIKDSFLNKRSAEKIVQMESGFQQEKKEQQIKQLESDKKIQTLSIGQKNTLNYLLGAVILILLTLSLFAYFAFKQKQVLQRKLINELRIEKKLEATEAIIRGQEEERSRLAKDLHDGLGGMLSGVKYSFQKDRSNMVMTPSAVESFQRSIDMLDTSILELRRVAHNLMPESMVKYGLSAAINDYCTSINNSGALKIIYQSFNADNLELDQSRAIILYRIVQELVNNTLKHAEASEMIVQLSVENDTLAITVEDDGKGFDASLIRNGQGMGWSNIYSRIDYLKGSLDVKSEPGKGTYVHLIINIKE